MVSITIPDGTLSVSGCELTETYSPAAIDMAPATRPAIPAIRMSAGAAAAAATPMMRLAVDGLTWIAMDRRILHQIGDGDGERIHIHQRQKRCAIGRQMQAPAGRYSTLVIPPSTNIVWPVMKLEASEARKMMAPANSSTSPQRRIGVRFSSQPENSSLAASAALRSVRK